MRAGPRNCPWKPQALANGGIRLSWGMLRKILSSRASTSGPSIRRAAGLGDYYSQGQSFLDHRFIPPRYPTQSGELRRREPNITLASLLDLRRDPRGFGGGLVRSRGV